MKMSDIKHIDIKEFRATGFLQESNRLFFHPHGLALEVNCVSENGWQADSNGFQPEVNEIALILSREFGDTYDQEACYDVAVQILNTLYPPDSEYISGVWDERDDPAGVWFDFASWPEGYNDGTPTPWEKYQNVLAERSNHSNNRIQLFTEAYGEQINTCDIEPVFNPDGDANDNVDDGGDDGSQGQQERFVD